MKLSYHVWLTAGLLFLLILFHSHLGFVRSSWKSYHTTHEDDDQKASADFGNSTSSSVVATKETEFITSTVSPSSNSTKTPAAPTPSDKIIVVGKLTTEDTTWVEEELSELVLRSLC